MNFNQGNMSSLTPCNSKSIMVGNGAIIPVSHIGQTFLPSSHYKFSLENVLMSNQMIKNLVSVRKFTVDNHVSVSFDPFGFSIKDLDSDVILHRCDSVGDLYPCTPSSTPDTILTAVVSSHLASSFGTSWRIGSSVFTVTSFYF